MKQNFATFAEGQPNWPAFMCLDGFVWHPNKTMRHCHRGTFECDARTLATVYQGEAVERVLALRTLLLDGRSQNYILSRVFPECSKCYLNNARRVAQVRSIWRRAAMAIHEDAIEMIREAQPHLDLLKNVHVLKSRRRVAEGKSARGLADKGIPVKDPNWDRRHPPQGEATRVAQVFWASDLIADDLEEAS